MHSFPYLQHMHMTILSYRINIRFVKYGVLSVSHYPLNAEIIALMKTIRMAKGAKYLTKKRQTA